MKAATQWEKCTRLATALLPHSPCPGEIMQRQRAVVVRGRRGRVAGSAMAGKAPGKVGNPAGTGHVPVGRVQAGVGSRLKSTQGCWGILSWQVQCRQGGQAVVHQKRPRQAGMG